MFLREVAAHMARKCRRFTFTLPRDHAQTVESYWNGLTLRQVWVRYKAVWLPKSRDGISSTGSKQR
jgi:hypothetical protein